MEDHFVGVPRDGSGQTFEAYVQWVYDQLLNVDLEAERVIVGRRVDIRGAGGLVFNVDVYYSFQRADLEHKVIVEVKDWSNRVDGDEVAAFVTRLGHIGGALGVMVARSGYQPLAKQLAEQHGIVLLGPGSFPNLAEMAARLLQSATLPDERTAGAPLWVLMVADDGASGTDGSYYHLPITSDGRKNVPLFLSRQHAAEYQRALRDSSAFVVRGLSQRQFIVLLRMATLHGKRQPILDFCIAMKPDEHARERPIIQTSGGPEFTMYPYRIWTLFADFLREVGKGVWNRDEEVF